MCKLLQLCTGLFAKVIKEVVCIATVSTTLMVPQSTKCKINPYSARSEESLETSWQWMLKISCFNKANLTSWISVRLDRGSCCHFKVDWRDIFYSGEQPTQKLRSQLLRTQSSKVPPLKPGIVQYKAMYATLNASDFIFAIVYPHDPFTCIFFRPLPSFPFVSCG